MYLMYADEADQDAVDKKFLIYGAIYIPSTSALELSNRISSLRGQFGFEPDDKLKFSTGTIPAHVSRKDHAALKSELLSAAADTDVRAVCYVVQHDVAKNQSKETKLKWAINTLTYNFQKFLKTNGAACGCMFFDRTTDYHQEEYLKEIGSGPINQLEAS